MNAGLTVLVCFLVIGPISVWLGWRFFKWLVIQHEIARLEAGLIIAAGTQTPVPAVAAV